MGLFSLLLRLKGEISSYDFREAIILSMKKIRSHLVGIDSADTVLFSDYENGGDMWTGEGHRERRRSVAFSETFRAPPVVHLSPSLWDFDTNTTMRADISATNVTASGFEIVLSTWGDTRIARMRVSWMAIGEIVDVGDWDVS